MFPARLEGISRCSSIRISDDEIVEGQELFSVGLQSSADVLGSPTNAFITISDTSSKLTSLKIIDMQIFLFKIQVKKERATQTTIL